MRSPNSLSAPSRRALERRRTAGLAALLAVVGIGSELPAGATTQKSFGRFEELRAQDLRVANVAYRLSVANQARCRETLAPQLGFIVHGIEQYGPVDREEAARRFGFGRHPGVMAVVEGSPAEKAGLATGDRLVAVNGRELSPGASPADGPATRAFVERAQQIITGEMRKGEVTLRVSGPQGDRDVTFAAEAGCPANVELVPGTAVNAWADGSRVVVSASLLRNCRSDDDLALVIAHELAHNILGHRERLARAGRLQSGRPGQPGLAAVRETEEEADRLGVRMAKAAAYDLAKADTFLDGLTRPAAGLAAAATHPEPVRRLALLRAEIAAAGGPG